MQRAEKAATALVKDVLSAQKKERERREEAEKEQARKEEERKKHASEKIHEVHDAHDVLYRSQVIYGNSTSSAAAFRDYLCSSPHIICGESTKSSS